MPQVMVVRTQLPMMAQSEWQPGLLCGALPRLSLQLRKETLEEMCLRHQGVCSEEEGVQVPLPQLQRASGLGFASVLASKHLLLCKARAH